MSRVRPDNYDPAADYYELLGLSSSASEDAIRRAFRQRAKDVHPDLNPDRSEWATQEFQRLNQAQEVLTDPERRRQYDSERETYLGVFGSAPQREYEYTPPPGKPGEGFYTRTQNRSRTQSPYGDWSRWENIDPSPPPPPRKSRRNRYRWLFYSMALVSLLWRIVNSTEYPPTSNSSAMATRTARYRSGSGFSATQIAMEECTSANVRITYPPAPSIFLPFYTQPFEVRGWATAPDFAGYSLLVTRESDYRNWSTVVDWRPQRPRNNIVAEASEMAHFLSKSGVYRLRLVVHQHAGPDLACDRLVSLVLVGNK